MMVEPSGRVAEIAASPHGPEVGAFFDLDGTLVSGFTATAHAGDRIRRRQARIGEVLGVMEASIRYRLYSGWGLGPAEIAALVVFNTLSFAFGYFTLVGVAMTIAPTASAGILHLPVAAVSALGAAFLALAGKPLHAL